VVGTHSSSVGLARSSCGKPRPPYFLLEMSMPAALQLLFHAAGNAHLANPTRQACLAELAKARRGWHGPEHAEHGRLCHCALGAGAEVRSSGCSQPLAVRDELHLDHRRGRLGVGQAGGKAEVRSSGSSPPLAVRNELHLDHNHH